MNKVLLFVIHYYQPYLIVMVSKSTFYIYNKACIRFFKSHNLTIRLEIYFKGSTREGWGLVVKTPLVLEEEGPIRSIS